MAAPMTAIRTAISAGVMFGISMIVGGCTPQPKSMFEQQAEAEAANMTLETQSDDVSDHTTNEVTDVTSAKTSDSDTSYAQKTSKTGADKADDDSHNTVDPVHIDATNQQLIARQPNCDSAITRCQYLELNVLAFSPKQPWLDSMMWQSIARTLAPRTPLAGQSQSAKNTVSMLLNQIAYSEQPDTSLPMYQRIDTHLHINPVTRGTASTAYLTITSSQQPGSSPPPHRYLMLDLQKKLQLTLRDIVLPQVSDSDVLTAFDPAKKAWLRKQGVDTKHLKRWPSHLPSMWYLDAKGLHLVYEPGEILPDQILSDQTDQADIMVPFAALQGLIKPEYQLLSAASSADLKDDI